MNPYDEPAPRTRRTRRMMITVPLHAPVPADQPALPFDPPQPAKQDLTITERFELFHAQNPHVYAALRSLALAEVESGARIVRTKHLFEELRSRGCPRSPRPTRNSSSTTSTPAVTHRLLDQEPGLTGRIPMRAIKSE